MAYNRNDALRYAFLYWDKICHDARVATKAGYPRQLNNVTLRGGLPFSQVGAINLEEDCTHFLSCCVGNHQAGTVSIPIGQSSSMPYTVFGGGLDIPSPFSDAGVYGQTWTPQLVQDLRSKGAKLVGKEFQPTSRSSMPDPAWRIFQAAIGSLEPGDVIAYASKDDPLKYEHICLIVAPGGKIACHTRARYGKDWDDVNFPWVTLLKMP